MRNYDYILADISKFVKKTTFVLNFLLQKEPY